MSFQFEETGLPSKSCLNGLVLFRLLYNFIGFFHASTSAFEIFTSHFTTTESSSTS
jgi:hypothetical protein